MPVNLRNLSGVAASSSLIFKHKPVQSVQSLRSVQDVQAVGEVTDSPSIVSSASRPFWRSRDFFPCRTARRLGGREPSHRSRRLVRGSSLETEHATAAVSRHYPISISAKLGPLHWTSLCG